jgi:hypothetical protein
MNEQCTARPTHARIEKAAPVKVPPRCYTGPSNEYVALARAEREMREARRRDPHCAAIVEMQIGITDQGTYDKLYRIASREQAAQLLGEPMARAYDAFCDSEPGKPVQLVADKPDTIWMPLSTVTTTVADRDHHISVVLDGDESARASALELRCEKCAHTWRVIGDTADRCPACNHDFSQVTMVAVGGKPQADQQQPPTDWQPRDGMRVGQVEYHHWHGTVLSTADLDKPWRVRFDNGEHSVPLTLAELHRWYRPAPDQPVVQFDGVNDYLGKPDPYLPPDADGIRWAREMPSDGDRLPDGWEAEPALLFRQFAEVTDAEGKLLDGHAHGMAITAGNTGRLIRETLPHIRANAAEQAKPSADPWGTYSGRAIDSTRVVGRQSGALGTVRRCKTDGGMRWGVQWHRGVRRRCKHTDGRLAPPQAGAGGAGASVGLGQARQVDRKVCRRPWLCVV